MNNGYKKNKHDKKGAEAKKKTPVLNNLESISSLRKVIFSLMHGIRGFEFSYFSDRNGEHELIDKQLMLKLLLL